MRILVLGGTRFLTRELTRLAVMHGHEVICAARGESGAVPDGARLVQIDRGEPDGLRPLADLDVDAVVDPATRPSWVRAALEMLGDRVQHWTYVSSCSVYSDEATPGQTENAPVKDLAPPGADETDMTIYGELKRASESAVLDAFPTSSLICRPGLIVGPGDRSGRFTYWPERLADGGRVLAPGAPDDLVQVVDVRDLAAWLIDAVETGLTGVFDTTSQPLPRAELLAAIAEGVGGDATLEWVDQTFLVEHEVEPWMGPRSIPLWLPLPEYAGFMARDTRAALDAGLRIRSFVETAADTLQWVRSDPDPARTGLTRDEEAELLAQWDRSRS